MLHLNIAKYITVALNNQYISNKYAFKKGMLRLNKGKCVYCDHKNRDL